MPMYRNLKEKNMQSENNIHEKITQIYDKTKNPLRQVIIMDHDPAEELWKKARQSWNAFGLTSALASYQCQCHELRKKSSSKSSKSVLLSLHTAGRFGIIPKKSGNKKLNETFMVFITSQK